MAPSPSTAKTTSWPPACCARPANWCVLPPPRAPPNNPGDRGGHKPCRAWRFHFCFKERFMQRNMLRAKLHRATVTQADLDYEGSCGIDEDLLDAADMREYEKIELYNVNNGERFSTYIIKGKRGSGEISLNGAAARRAHVGDKLIICTYAPMTEEEIAGYKPKIVLLGDNNRIKEIKAV
ncbi:Aspartate 1-decarboxylase [Ralstonia solanacearum UW551]|nr:Aspartate 1-decarboxylase [Ralstonia solanacearum UW551]